MFEIFVVGVYPGAPVMCADFSETQHIKAHGVSVTNCNDKAELEVTCERSSELKSPFL